jgi:hypothetical protein
VGMGFFGYMKYGSGALGSITLNLPSNEMWVATLETNLEFIRPNTHLIYFSLQVRLHFHINVLKYESGVLFYHRAVMIPVAPQTGPVCSGSAGSRYLLDARSAVLRGSGHHVEPLHASKTWEILSQNGFGIRREDLPRIGHM